MIQYISYPLKNIVPDKELPGDLYLFVSGHFIKYKNTGDVITVVKYDQFALKRIQFVFIDANDSDKYASWYDSVKAAENKLIEKAVGKENIEIVKVNQEIKDNVIDLMFGDNIDKNTKEIVDKTRTIVSLVKDRKTTQDYLAKMLSYGQGIVDHSTNVATLSIFIAINIGYGQQLLLENIYLGALLHDYGKILINPKYFENTSSRSYKHAMKKHPILGMNNLESTGHYNSEVLRIIAEHHEMHDGTGFPNKLSSSKIYDLTKIVSISNIFDNIMTATKGTIQERQKKSILELEKDRGHQFDPKILEKALKAMKLVMG